MGNILVDINNSTGNIYQYSTGIYDRNSVLRIMSLTKLVTGAVILALFDEGLIDINQTVGHYIPSWAGNGKEAVTIKQIMGHTSGISAEGTWDGPGKNLQEIADLIATQTSLQFTPGTQYAYQSAPYQVVARIAEVVTGQSWDTVFNTRIRDKCGMGGAAYNPWEFTPNPLAGHGLQCKHGEYMNFLKMLFNKGLYNGVRVLNEYTVALMEQDATSGIQQSRGFGLIRNEIEGGVCKEPTGESSAGCYAWINRDKKYYACLFTQAEYGATILKNIEFRNLVRSTLPTYS